MLENIKSSYFLNIIFSFLDEKIKLKIAKYNKNLQKKIDVNLINYKFLSGRYIIYENNGIIKEYDGYFDNLVYEGEYLNGKRHGKGKEYFNNSIIYDGEFLNGKRNGKGKEYEYGELKYEGEYINGKRNGKGKEYSYEKCKLMFEGIYLNDKKWEGKGYDKNNNIIYELKDGQGFIKEYNYKGKLIFEGEYKNGKKNGKVKKYNDEGILLGD